jgi:hypothetical protein
MQIAQRKLQNEYDAMLRSPQRRYGSEGFGEFFQHQLGENLTGLAHHPIGL